MPKNSRDLSWCRREEPARPRDAAADRATALRFYQAVKKRVGDFLNVSTTLKDLPRGADNRIIAGFIRDMAGHLVGYRTNDVIKEGYGDLRGWKARVGRKKSALILLRRSAAGADLDALISALGSLHKAL